MTEASVSGGFIGTPPHFYQDAYVSMCFKKNVKKCLKKKKTMCSYVAMC